MTPSDFSLLRQSIKNDEGLRLLPYVDVSGKLTIGYGRNLSDNGINQLEAGEMLDQDLTRHVSDLLRAFPFVDMLDSTRQVVLANMCFNMGIGRLSKFVLMWDAIKHGDYQMAATEMLNSVWATQVGKRATRLAAAMASGELKV